MSLISLRRNGPIFTRTCSLARRNDWKIICEAGCARLRKMPPFLGVVHKALPSHGHNQQIPPTALFRRDGLRGRMRLCVGTIIAGAHVDATFRGAGADRRGAVGVGLGWI